MALNFPGWTKAKLLESLEAALDEQSSGATLSDTGAGDTSSRFQVQVSIQTRIDMLSQDLVSRWPEEFLASDYLHPRSGRYVS